jgi:hypothetical protein
VTTGIVSNDAAAWVDVWTGAATVQTGAATAHNTSTTANISPSVTTTASGSQVAGVACDWNDAGSPTSTDTIDGYANTDTSGARAYKASNSGAAGAVTLNFHSPGSPLWSYVLYEILAPGGGGGTTITPSAGSDTLTGNAPTVTAALNTVLFPVTA